MAHGIKSSKQWPGLLAARAGPTGPRRARGGGTMPSRCGATGAQMGRRAGRIRRTPCRRRGRRIFFGSPNGRMKIVRHVAAAQCRGAMGTKITKVPAGRLNWRRTTTARKRGTGRRAKATVLKPLRAAPQCAMPRAYDANNRTVALTNSVGMHGAAARAVRPAFISLTARARRGYHAWPVQIIIIGGI